MFRQDLKLRAGIKIDTDVYREDILEPTKVWALQHYGTDNDGFWNEWIYQQDSAPSHASTNENPEEFKIPTQRWLAEHFPDFIKKNEWPASSPDLNPLDYSIWSILEAQVNEEAHESVKSLKQAIQEAFENLNQEMINRAIDDWPRRLDAVIAANEGHFE
uniref:Uncharacterized protein n=1 Tax=Acrobeloides nanus TaxID=290746 RepID=A0A914DIN1_9BILA